MAKRIKSTLNCYAVRLLPGDDLVHKLKEYIIHWNIAAACIVTCVGSLKQAKLRLADATAESSNKYCYIKTPVEIVSLVGTLSSLGGMHLHISLADHEGKVTGGHLMPEGAIVHTTVELVIGECEGITFFREIDQNTGFHELTVQSKDSS